MSCDCLYDHGKNPFIFNINKLALINTNYRTTLYTGDYMQLTLMSINVNSCVGLEKHPDNEQFIRIVRGKARILMGKEKNELNISAVADSNFAVIVPKNTWHNIINIGSVPLKLYSVYAPPHHPFNTVHRTKAEAEERGD